MYNYVSIDIGIINIKTKNVLDKSIKTKRLDVQINPSTNHFTMNYLIFLCISNLFWYCTQYPGNTKEMEKNRTNTTKVF